ncbi:MAG: FAD-dependent oxidoreductase, partial [Actinomycetia bacterium]|nr:FAD-dependent oxidoreductase [Actinomycetes bacterium]
MDIVVVGGGMAGVRLAQQLAPCAAVRVTVVGEEPHRPYNRVLLAEVLAGRYGPELIALPDGGAVAGPPRRAVALDRARRRVVCDDGHELGYDRLVLATGSNPVLPPLRGLFTPSCRELPSGIHAFRTLDDCLALARAAGEGTRAVVVGGGLLGVSAARALAARGAHVVLAQQAGHLMERHLDAPAAGLLQRHLEGQGVEVHTGCRVRGVRVQPHDGPAGRRVRAVELADGYCLETDVVVLACGVRPRTALALAAGIAVDRGVVVDDRLCTSDPAVFAIGDCAQHDGVVHGLAGAARDQADVLARVLAAEAGDSGSEP